jgi:hypothetical protein
MNRDDRHEHERHEHERRGYEGRDADARRGTSAADGSRGRMRRYDPDADEQGGGLSPTLRRTALFVLAGAGMLMLGAAVQPRFKTAKIEPEEQRMLFPELADAAKAASLEIVSYDDELSTLHPFKVIQSGGVWVLPAHQNYPADAKEQLAAAATALVDLKMLDVVSKSPGDHETYGVIEPDPEKIKPGMTGVGQLVEIRDASGNKLARLVVGKEDKRRTGPEDAGRTLRFVRKAGQDPVYRVEIDTSKLTTRFGDWIEKDLLKLSPWDVRRLGLEDYSLVAVESNGRVGVQLDRKSRLNLAYDDKNAKWSLLELVSFTKEGEPKVEKLAEDEELAAARLNDLRNALGDLKIVDVARKPAGLSAELKAEESFTNDREAVTSMQQRGFLPLKSGEILSTDGETIVGMKDGVEYVLRFGAATTVAAEAAKGDAAKDAPGETSGRYLLVMARFNEGLLEKPQLEPLPDLPATDEKKASAKATEKDAGKAADTTIDKPADKVGGQENAKENAATPAPAAKEGGVRKADDGSSGAAGPGGAAGTAGEGVGGDAAAAKAADAAEGSKPPEAGAAAALKKADEDEAKAQAAIENRRRVERENRRKQDEYDDRVKAAQRRVRELNGRFADWYYVVPNKEYAKIHLGRADAVQKVEAKEKPAAPAVP